VKNLIYISGKKPRGTIKKVKRQISNTICRFTTKNTTANYEPDSGDTEYDECNRLHYIGQEKSNKNPSYTLISYPFSK